MNVCGGKVKGNQTQIPCLPSPGVSPIPPPMVGEHKCEEAWLAREAPRALVLRVVVEVSHFEVQQFI